MTILETVNASASPETQMNNNAIATGPAGMFGIKLKTTSGLLLAIYGGLLYVDGVATAIADLDGGTRITLTGSTTNYVERTRAGVVSANTSGFTAGRIPLYTVVTSSTAITSYTDYRDFTTPLQKARVGVTVTTTDVTLTAAQARVDEVKATGTLTGNRNLIVPTVAGAWIVDNATAGAFTLTVKTAAGAGVVVPQGSATLVYCDGTDVKAAISGIAGDLKVGGTLTVSGATITTGSTTALSLATTAGTILTLVNSTVGGEKARITAAGYFKASNGGAYAGATSTFHELYSTTADTEILRITHTNASPYGEQVLFTASPDNNTNFFVRYGDGTINRAICYSDGDWQNHDNSYGAISDERLKTNIVDAKSQLDDFRQYRFRNYDFISDIEAGKKHTQIGLIAQEVLPISPGLVFVGADDMYGLQYSVLAVKAAKALQETIFITDNHEARLTALEARFN